MTWHELRQGTIGSSEMSAILGWKDAKQSPPMIHQWLHTLPPLPIPSEHDYQYTRVIMPRNICRRCGIGIGIGISGEQCGKCREAIYCSKQCQVQDWKWKHEHYCMPKNLHHLGRVLTDAGFIARQLSLGMNTSDCGNISRWLWELEPGGINYDVVVTSLMTVLVLQRGFGISACVMSHLSLHNNWEILAWLLNAGFDPNELQSTTTWWAGHYDSFPFSPHVMMQALALPLGHIAEFTNGFARAMAQMLLFGFKPELPRDIMDDELDISQTNADAIAFLVQLAQTARVNRCATMSESLMTMLGILDLVDICLRYLGNEIELPKRIQVLDPN